MSNKLKSLYNTLCQIETKGENTLIMGDCLKFIHQCIQECEEQEKAMADLQMKVTELEQKLATE